MGLREKERWATPSSRGYRGSAGRSSRRFSLRRLTVIVVIVAILAIAGAVGQLLRAVPSPTFTQTLSLPTSSVKAPTIPWPTQGSGVLEIPGVGVLGSFGTSQPIAIASVAKMMTAYLVIKDHPLSLGQTGPSVTLTQSDYQTYQQQLAAQDSVMAVAPGETLTEYQMLEALLIPSADNIAVTLANWDAGSVSSFVAKMNATAKALGMTSTTYTDPSGLDSKTVSTPSDQLKIAQLVMSNPVLAQIVSLPQATLPVAGVVYNVDYDLGTDGIVGIKTGSTPSGGNFAFDAQVTSGTAPYSVLGVILGQQGAQPLITALDAAKAVVTSLGSEPPATQVVAANGVVGAITVPGRSQAVSVLASSPISMVDWAGLTSSATVSLKKLHYPVAKGSVIGTLSVTIGSQHKVVNVVAAGQVLAPPISWRLRRL